MPCHAGRPGVTGGHRQTERPPPARPRAPPSPARGRSPRASASAASSPGRTRCGRPLRHFGHRRALGGDQRGAARQRLEGRQAETLLERPGRPPPWPGAAARAPPRRAGSPTRTIRSPCRAPARARSVSASPQPICPHRTSTASRWASATRSKAATSDATPLRGSSVPTKATSGRSSGTPLACEQGAIGARRRLDRREAGVVDPVGRHHDRCPHVAAGPQPRRRDLAHTDESARMQAGLANGPAEEQRLRPDVPLGVVEERAVVNGHDARARAHVRAWCSAGPWCTSHPERAEEPREACLLEDEATGPRGGDGAHRPGPRRPDRPPPLLVAAARAPWSARCPGERRGRAPTQWCSAPPLRGAAGRPRRPASAPTARRSRQRPPQPDVLAGRVPPGPGARVRFPARRQVGTDGVIGQ